MRVTALTHTQRHPSIHQPRAMHESGEEHRVGVVRRCHTGTDTLHSPLSTQTHTGHDIPCTPRTNSREHFSYRTSHVHRRSHLAYPTDRVDRDIAHTHHDNVASRITKPSSTVTLTVGGERERGASALRHTLTHDASSIRAVRSARGGTWLTATYESSSGFSLRWTSGSSRLYGREGQKNKKARLLSPLRMGDPARCDQQARSSGHKGRG